METLTKEVIKERKNTKKLHRLTLEALPTSLSQVMMRQIMVSDVKILDTLNLSGNPSWW